jgi:transposase-like protein
MDFRLPEPRAEHAAKPFLTKALQRQGGGPANIPMDGRAANEAALKTDNAAHGTAIAIRKRT